MTMFRYIGIPPNNKKTPHPSSINQNYCVNLQAEMQSANFMSTNRRIISRLLLVLYVCSLVMAFTHHHDVAEPGTTVCVDCKNHVQHHSHIGAAENLHDNCLLCQFLTVPLLLVPLFSFRFYDTKGCSLMEMPERREKTKTFSFRRLRAPPFHIYISLR
jgi:hypothetical protein